MDDSPRPPEAADTLPPQAPECDGRKEADVPEGFVCLRLLLQPGGLRVELDRPDMLVGRHSSADVRLCLPDVSRRHCRFVFSAGRWQVFDLNSLNGVFVNGRRLEQAVLAHGDIIGIGCLTFRVDIGEPGVLGGIADVLPPQRKAS
jgi:pSer/pThr/pTyr-binding forkhead associated (FHA) protein